MHGAIDLSPQKRAIEFLGPQRLAPDFGQRAILHAVSGGLDDNDLGIHPMRGGQRGADHIRLDKRERRTAGAEADRGHLRPMQKARPFDKRGARG